MNAENHWLILHLLLKFRALSVEQRTLIVEDTDERALVLHYTDINTHAMSLLLFRLTPRRHLLQVIVTSCVSVRLFITLRTFVQRYEAIESIGSLLANVRVDRSGHTHVAQRWEPLLSVFENDLRQSIVLLHSVEHVAVVLVTRQPVFSILPLCHSRYEPFRVLSCVRRFDDGLF